MILRKMVSVILVAGLVLFLAFSYAEAYDSEKGGKKGASSGALNTVTLNNNTSGTLKIKIHVGNGKIIQKKILKGKSFSTVYSKIEMGGKVHRFKIGYFYNITD